MGTPEFAVPGLLKLIENNKNVIAVITAPDKPAGRGLKPQMSAVKSAALEHNIPVLQPENLKAPDFIETLKALKADLQIVIAFRMLPEVVWNMPLKGTFNLHASLLPQYRGAAPINWAIINGEKETGVTTFFLQHQIDTGNIIYQEKVVIQQDDDFESLYRKLMFLGADVVLKTVNAIEAGINPSSPQNHEKDLKPAPKILKETCKIDWENSAEYLVNFIRGLSPYPAAWTQYNGKTLKIFKAENDTSESGKETGSWISDNKTFVKVQTSKGLLSLKEIQIEGKKRMNVEEFLRGNKF